MGKDVIIACDFDSAEKTFAFLDKFTGKTIGFTDSEAELGDIVIAGATRTSKPVTIAVDTALRQIAEMTGGGAENE